MTEEIKYGEPECNNNMCPSRSIFANLNCLFGYIPTNCPNFQRFNATGIEVPAPDIPAMSEDEFRGTDKPANCNAKTCTGYNESAPLNCRHGSIDPAACQTYQFFNNPVDQTDMVNHPDDTETDYRPGSIVSEKKTRIKEIVDAHWNYMEKVLTTGQDQSRTFTWEQVMAMRKWDYTSAAIHFYGHGYEDATK